MRIAHSVNTYWPKISGSEEYMRNVSERLVEKSYDVTVLTEKDFLKGSEEILNGVRIRRYPRLRGFHPLSPFFRNFRDPFSGMMSSLAYGFTPSIYFDIIKSNYDLVHATPIPANNVVLSFFAARKARTPFVCTPLFHVKMREFYNDLYLKVLRNADAVLVCTYTEGKILSRLGVDGNKIHKISLGIDLVSPNNVSSEHFRRKHAIDSSPIVLFGARKTREKGAFFVLDAMKKVWKESPDVYLVAMGDKNSTWLKCLSSLSNEERKKIIDLEWPKPSERQEKMAVFAACDVFVMPSITDAFGLVYLESWMCNKPVVAADTPVMREVVSSEKDGFLVEFGNTVDLARKIITLLHDEKLRKKMGAYGKNKVLRNHNWTSTAEQISSLYEATANRS